MAAEAQHTPFGAALATHNMPGTQPPTTTAATQSHAPPALPTHHVLLSEEDKYQMTETIKKELNYDYLQASISDLMEWKVPQKLTEYHIDDKLKEAVNNLKIDDKIQQSIQNNGSEILNVKERILAIENRTITSDRTQSILEYKSIQNLDKLGAPDIKYSQWKSRLENSLNQLKPLYSPLLRELLKSGETRLIEYDFTRTCNQLLQEPHNVQKLERPTRLKWTLSTWIKTED